MFASDHRWDAYSNGKIRTLTLFFVEHESDCHDGATVLCQAAAPVARKECQAAHSADEVCNDSSSVSYQSPFDTSNTHFSSSPRYLVITLPVKYLFLFSF
ncbi:hypothetical protein RvY_03715 [Ramazzottius varieornatus]|uniref:Uncharacterized protein n=1 Tax=Ramazzottius varieornatus TaxID=947166 RepID=A0A1D1UYF8_RAMVA|nr:hypothetical protein RvY_03715 [Ramazzottius varieornatus]